MRSSFCSVVTSKKIHTVDGISSTQESRYFIQMVQVFEFASRDAARNVHIVRIHKYLSEQAKVFLTDRASFTFKTGP